MSDAIKHECGIALVRLKKPLQFYKDKYGSAFYGINKMYLLMEKQHNRGQDGAGFASVKFNVEPGTRYISRVRSNKPTPIQDIFAQINGRLNGVLEENPDKKDDVRWQEENMPYVGNLFLGHVRYGTFGKNSIESVHPFLRQSNWKHQNLIVAGLAARGVAAAQPGGQAELLLRSRRRSRAERGEAPGLRQGGHHTGPQRNSTAKIISNK